MKTIRVIVVGCGYFGQKRIDALAGIKKQCRLVGIVDHNLPLAKKLSFMHNVPYASTITRLLRVVSADLAVVAVPNKYHSACTIDALEHGMHVLCEKPLASTKKEANRIVSAANKSHLFVKTGSNHRFLPIIQRVYHLLSRGVIGKVFVLKGAIGNNGARVKNTWFWNPTVSGGGTFIDNGSHVVDIAQWLMGDFISCFGSIASNYWMKAGAEDFGVGIFKTKDGGQAIITSSWTQWVGYFSLELWGDKGYMFIDTKSNNTVVVGDKDGKRKQVLHIKEPRLSSYQQELMYFARCIHQKREPSPNAIDGAKVVSYIDGLYKSAKTKKQVQL